MFENIKNKAVKFATNPKCVKAFNKVTNAVTAGSAAVTALGLSAFSASAEGGGIDWGATVTASTALSQISEGASPFIEPSIIIMCGVAGLRLGMRFLRGSTH